MIARHKRIHLPSQCLESINQAQHAGTRPGHFRFRTRRKPRGPGKKSKTMLHLFAIRFQRFCPRHTAGNSTATINCVNRLLSFNIRRSFRIRSMQSDFRAAQSDGRGK